MLVDGDIQVWLESDGRKGSLITPYIQSPDERTIQYLLKAVKSGRSGRSQITQSGTVTTTSNQPVALGRFSISIASDDECHIELFLTDDGALLAEFMLPCPR